MPEILFYPYFGPSRRSDLRVLEIRLDFDPDEAYVSSQQISDTRQILLDAGVITSAEIFPDQPLAEEQFARYSELLAQTALLLQKKNGHLVRFFSVSREAGRDRFTVLVEHEHSEVGMAAVQLAIEVITGRVDAFANTYRQFSGFARERVLPIETTAIINMARQRNIPVFQLEREPLTGNLKFSFRIRPNGLLILGYGKSSQILDGTFCVNRAGD